VACERLDERRMAGRGVGGHFEAPPDAAEGRLIGPTLCPIREGEGEVEDLVLAGLVQDLDEL
jgi:hypothetical protein